MRITHKLIGVALVITGLVHGIFSGEPVISLNTGTICWVVSILMCLNWMTRKLLIKQGNWNKYHRILTVIFLLTLGLHLIHIKIFDNRISEIMMGNKYKNTTVQYISKTVVFLYYLGLPSLINLAKSFGSTSFSSISLAIFSKS